MVDLLLAVIVALIAAVAYFLKGIMDDTRELANKMGAVMPAIIEIQGKFSADGYKLAFPLTVAPGSPLKVTDFGAKLLKDAGFYKVLKNNHKTLVELVKIKNPRTNYDIQQSSIEVIADLLEGGSALVVCLKEHAFNHGMNVDIFLDPAGIALRDEVMKELKF